MIPNTFEAYTLTGSAGEVSYTGGYITKKKNRESDSFVWMSNIAGGEGNQRGVIYAGGTWNFGKIGSVRMDEQYAVDVFNTFYVDGRYLIPIDDKTSVTLRAQYYPQTSVGDEQIGSFSTYGVGLQAAVGHGPVEAQLYYTQTGRGYSTQAPFGVHASYLSMMISDFNTAGEKAWGLGANVNFSSLGAPGLTAAAMYASSSDRIDSADGSAIPEPERDRRPGRLRGRQGNPPRRAGGHGPLRVAASGRLAADADAVARLHQLRGQVLGHRITSQQRDDRSVPLTLLQHVLQLVLLVGVGALLRGRLGRGARRLGRTPAERQGCQRHADGAPTAHSRSRIRSMVTISRE